MINKYLTLLSKTNPHPSTLKTFKTLMAIDKKIEESKESCLDFCSGTNNGCDILFKIMLDSNHFINIVNNCINILINLAKIPDCVAFIIDFEHAYERLNYLIEILKANLSNNSKIFINTCILLILLCINLNNVDYLIEIFSKDCIIAKKLMSVYESIENQSKNGVCQSVNIKFTFEPKWSQTEKHHIQFKNNQSALKYLLFETINYTN
jgi:hypothetical protein